MKFKILKGTALFEKFIALQTEMKRCNDITKATVNEMGYGTQWYKPHGSIAGGIVGFIIPSGKPTGWANAFTPNEKDAYMPKKIKANADLLKRIKELPVVTTEDFNKIIKYDWRKACGEKEGMGRRTVSYSPGFSVKDEYVLIDVSEAAPKYKPIKDMVEITVSEYNKLK